MRQPDDNNPDAGGQTERDNSEVFPQSLLTETYAVARPALKAGIEFDSVRLKEFEEIQRSGKIEIAKQVQKIKTPHPNHNRGLPSMMEPLSGSVY